MPVNTSRVSGRRKLRFRDFGEVRADILDLHARPHRALGNWSLAQIVKHLGQAMHGSVDGPSFTVPLYLRVVGRLLLRPYMLNVKFPSGFRLPRAAARLLVFEQADFDEALDRFDTGIAHMAASQQRMVHPVVGKLSPAEWDRFHLRHCEMHLGFLVPE